MRLKEIVDVAQGLFTIAAIVVGALWSYFHYFRGRTYRPRLEPSVSGRTGTQQGLAYVIADVKLENVGLSKVPIQQRGTALRVLACEIENPGRAKVVWKRLSTLEVFKNHGWIEPRETIEDRIFVPLTVPRETVLRLELRLVSNGISWRTTTIIDSSGDGRATARGAGSEETHANP